MAQVPWVFRTDNTASFTLPANTVTAGGDTTLDFAWNNPRVQFNTNTTSSATGASNTFRTNFDYNGTSSQLTQDFNNWSTPTTVTGTFTFSRGGKIRDALMQIFVEPAKELKKQMSKQEKRMLRAKRRSEKLLKQFLSPKEYNSLKLHGELAVPSEMDDEVIFIVKKDPNQMVDVKKKGKYSHKLCAVAEDLEMPVGDQLLSKVLLIKTDEKKFREIAIRHV